MRTRWMLAASIVVLLVTIAPGALRAAAEEPGCAPAAVTTVTNATASTVVNVPSPATTTLPFLEPTLASSQQPPRGIDEPLFLICGTDSCPPLRCSSLHNCVLAGCCH